MMHPGPLPDPDFVEIGNLVVPAIPSEQLRQAVVTAQEQRGTTAGLAAQHDIIELGSHLIYLAVKRILLSEALAEAALEEIFEEVFFNVLAFDVQVEPVEHWILRIALRIAREHKARLDEEEAVPLVCFMDDAGAELILEQGLTLDRWSYLSRVLGTIPPVAQQSYILTVDEGYTVEQVSLVVGRDVDWVKLWLRSIRALLSSVR